MVGEGRAAVEACIPRTKGEQSPERGREKEDGRQEKRERERERERRQSYTGTSRESGHKSSFRLTPNNTSRRNKKGQISFQKIEQKSKNQNLRLALFHFERIETAAVN